MYAVDIIANAGRSVDDGRPVDTLAGFMDWLDGLFSQVGTVAILRRRAG